MNTVILYAHPNTEQTGNCQTILGATQRLLESRNEEYLLIDLYKDGFNPVLQAEEYYVSGNKFISPEVLKYQEILNDAKYIIVIHPIWWAGMPAMLKGFFDKVLTPGFGYEYINGVPKKLFKGKKSTVFVTSGGPWWWTYFGQGSRASKNIAKDILGFLGIKTKVFLLAEARVVTDETKVKVDKLVNKGIKSLYK